MLDDELEELDDELELDAAPELEDELEDELELDELPVALPVPPQPTIKVTNIKDRTMLAILDFIMFSVRQDMYSNSYLRTP